MGGTFSVSNLGMFGVAEFSAVVNPPQACILAVGGGVRTVLPGLPRSAAQDAANAKVGAPGSEGGVVARAGPRVATVMTARVSVDRRVADEALAGQFLQCFKAYMSQPHLLML
jgi:pyruvate dehydrogenase E2 component (dihydrolipoamide acetyltransferase)